MSLLLIVATDRYLDRGLKLSLGRKRPTLGYAGGFEGLGLRWVFPVRTDLGLGSLHGVLV